MKWLPFGAVAKNPYKTYIPWNIVWVAVQHKNDMGVSLNGGTPKTPQNDHF